LGEKSRSSDRQFLFRRIAERLRARAEGDLSERARRRAREIADDADLLLAATPLSGFLSSLHQKKGWSTPNPLSADRSRSCGIWRDNPSNSDFQCSDNRYLASDSAWEVGFAESGPVDPLSLLLPGEGEVVDGLVVLETAALYTQSSRR